MPLCEGQGGGRRESQGKAEQGMGDRQAERVLFCRAAWLLGLAPGCMF